MSRVTCLAALGLAAAAVVMPLGTPAHALLLAPRYATTTGSGGTCSQLSPCSIVTAINDATAGAEVIIEPGTYGSPTPLSAELTDNGGGSGDLNIHGEAGQPMPLIYSSATYGFGLQHGSTLSHVAEVSTGAETGLLLVDSTADHVIIESSDGDVGACSVYSTFSDALCLSTGDSLAALESDSSGVSPFSIRNVTAVATGTGGIGYLDLAGTAAVDPTITNSILRGPGADVAAETISDTASATVTLHHTDSRPSHDTSSGPGTQTIARNTTDISAAPKFVDPTTNDYKEKAGSPTINRGSAVSGTDTDLAGLPRTLGAHPDMGAYEFAEVPVVGKTKVTSVGAKLVEVTSHVNPEGLLGAAQLVVSRPGKKPVRSHPVSVGSADHAAKVTLTVHHLKAHHRYKLRVVAVNAAGHAKARHLVTHTSS